MSPTLLSEKLLAAKGGDREIDALLCIEFRDAPPNIRTYTNTIMKAPWRHTKGGEVEASPVGLPATQWYAERYTADLSAAVALIKSQLPQAKIHMHFNPSISEVALTIPVDGFSNDKLLAHFLRTDGEIALAACCAFVEAIGEKT